MRILLVLLFVLLSGQAQAEWSNWTPDNKGLFIASQLAITADWATTRNAARRNWPNNTYETNPILGRYPSTEKVDLYMIGLLVSNYYVTDWLPKQYRNFYLGMRIVIHTSAADNNIRLGWHMRF